MRKFLILAFVFCSFTVCAIAQDTTTLIYPTEAADSELDNSSPAKRITPPAREETEVDPVTPLGQIRAVIESLETLETQQKTLLDTVGRLRLDENDSLLPLLERGSKERATIGENVSAISVKIDAIQKTTADLRASVEAVQKTAASIERIRTSRWTDRAVIAILALVLIQIAWKVGGSIVVAIKARAARFRELAAAYELARQQLAEKETTKQ